MIPTATDNANRIASNTSLRISAYIINTAIENTVDLITKEKNEQDKIAKDVAAGAVLVSAIVAAIIGLMIFVPKISLIY